MKEIINQVGIVLKSSYYKESSRLVTILTNDGLKNVIIKGVDKEGSRTKKYVQSPLLMEFNSTNSSLSAFTGGSIIDSYTELLFDLDKYQACLVIIEKVLKFDVEIQDKELLYNFVKDLFELLKKTNYPNSVSLIFEIKLLYLLGVAFNFKSCPICGELLTEGLFSVHHGGFLCKKCSYKHFTNLNIDESLELKKIYLTKLKNIGENELEEYSKYNLESVIDEYYLYHLEFTSLVKRTKKEIDEAGRKHEQN